MARVNISIPDDIQRRAKETGLNISKLTRDAIVAELDRLAKIEALDRYLTELEDEFGPPTAEETTQAKEWADRVLGQTDQDRRTA